MLTISLLIFSTLLLVTLVIEYQYTLNKTVEINNNRIRVRTWWLICAICIPVLITGGWVITLFIYVLIYWSAIEFSRLLNVRINSLSILFFTSALLTYHFTSFIYKDSLSIFYYTPLLFFLASVTIPNWLPRITSLRAILVLMLCISSIFSIDLIRLQCETLKLDAGLLILFLFFITASNDIFQYFSGKKYGCHPLALNLSPHKTWEGALGGLVLTTITSMLTLPYIIEVSGLTAARTGFVISILGIAGDLNISYLKRRANAKDSGTSLPGHGGLLDRIDSLIFTAPGFGLCLDLVFIS